MFNVLLNEIPLAEASSFFIRLRDFEKTADENNVASSEYAPPDESGRFEGQFTVPVEAALKLMSEMLANELKTMYAYKVYANSLRDLTHHSIAEEFEDHADQELEHADFLMRRMAILGGPVQGPDIVAPPPSTDPKDIVQRMIRIEQEGIERWKKLHSITGDNPTKYKIEEFMTREQEHLDELWQLVPHSAPPVLTHGGTTSSTFSPPELPPSAPDTMPTPPDYKTAAWRKIAQMPGGLPPTAMGQQSAPTPPMPLTGGAAGQQSMPSPPSPLSGPAAGENMKMAFAKFAKKEEKGLSPSTKAMLGLPLLGAASGAAIMGLSGIGRAGTGSALSNAGRGLATGAAFGTAASALIGMGKLLEKADPSGRTLRTVVELAPAAIAVGGAIRDSREEERRSKHAEKQDADQVAAGRARAIANLSSGFTSDENTRGERAGDLIGRLTGAGGGGAAGYRMMRGQGPALELAGTLGGAALGQHLMGRAGKMVGQELDARSFADKYASAFKLAFDEMAPGMPSQEAPMGMPGMEQAPQMDPATMAYLQQEQAGRAAEQEREQAFYKQKFEQAAQELQQAQQASQAAQQQVQQLQQQVDQGGQMQQQALDQAKQIQQAALANAQAAHAAATQAMQQSLQAQQESLQQAQLAVGMRDAVQAMKQGLMQMVQQQLPPATTAEAGAAPPVMPPQDNSQQPGVEGEPAEANQAGQPAGAPNAGTPMQSATPGDGSGPGVSPSAGAGATPTMEGATPQGQLGMQGEPTKTAAHERLIGALVGGAAGGLGSFAETRMSNEPLRQKIQALEAQEREGKGSFLAGLNLAQAKARLAHGEFVERHPVASTAMGTAIGALIGSQGAHSVFGPPDLRRGV